MMPKGRGGCKNGLHDHGTDAKKRAQPTVDR
jgi:hypothetical protein